MPLVSTWLDKEHFKQFENGAEKAKLKPYKYHQKLLLKAMANDRNSIVVRTTIIYLFTLYSLIASVVVLVF